MTILTGIDDYRTIRVYLEGFFHGLQYSTGFNGFKELSNYLIDNYGITGSTPFTLYPEYFHKDKSDAEKKEMLLDIITDFVNEYYK